MPPTPENVDMVQRQYKYYRATPRNLLIYTEKRKPIGSLLVKKAEALDRGDQGWLLGCNFMILSDAANSCTGSLDNMSKFLRDLDAELGKEMAKEG